MENSIFDPTLRKQLKKGVVLAEPEIEELLPKKKEFLRSEKKWQVPCDEGINSSLDPALKNRDWVELLVQNRSKEPSIVD
jgi:hypothetical protein